MKAQVTSDGRQLHCFTVLSIAEPPEPWEQELLLLVTKIMPAVSWVTCWCPLTGLSP